MKRILAIICALSCLGITTTAAQSKPSQPTSCPGREIISSGIVLQISPRGDYIVVLDRTSRQFLARAGSAFVQRRGQKSCCTEFTDLRPGDSVIVRGDAQPW